MASGSGGSSAHKRRPATPTPATSNKPEPKADTGARVKVEPEPAAESTRTSARLESRRPLTPSSDNKECQSIISILVFKLQMKWKLIQLYI